MSNQKQEDEPIYFTDKERYILWAIAAWFQVNGMVTSSLMSKLYSRNIDTQKNRDKFDTLIDARIKDVAEFLARKEEKL